MALKECCSTIIKFLLIIHYHILLSPDVSKDK